MYYFISLQVCSIRAKLNLKSIKGIYDVKTFKKFMKTHKNVIVIFSKDGMYCEGLYFLLH